MMRTDTDLRRALISSIFSGRSSAKRSFRVWRAQASQKADPYSQESFAQDNNRDQATAGTRDRSYGAWRLGAAGRTWVLAE